MKKMIGITMMIAALTVGSLTVYAAPVIHAGEGCTRSADCPVHDDCADADFICDYEGCLYGGAEGCYRDHGNHEDFQDCEYYRDHCENHRNHGNQATGNQSGRSGRHHNGTGARHGRGHC